MRNTLVIIAVLILAGAGTTQSVMPMPPFTNTYSYTYTRGFYFQAPIDFTIVGMQVPDESKDGKQNVAIYRHATAPAYIPGVKGNLVFYKGGEPSNVVIPCAVNFKKGEFVCILGACGDSTQLDNSYGSGPFKSSVLGAATSIYRMGMQANFVLTNGAGNIWGTTSGSVGRVHVHVSSASLVGSGTGTPGTAIAFTLKSVADAGLPYQLGSALGNGPIPIDTRTLGLSPDALLVLSVGGLLPATFQGYTGLLDQNGEGKAQLNIPNFPVLKGVRIYTAFVTLLATAPSGVSSISNSFLFTIQ
jgi:hypothetical protein